MFCNCISKQNYSNKDEKCKNNDCIECLIEELLKENWQDKPEIEYLKIAHEKNIIDHAATSISDLNEEEKKNLIRINYLYVLNTYHVKS